MKNGRVWSSQILARERARDDQLAVRGVAGKTWPREERVEMARNAAGTRAVLTSKGMRPPPRP